MDWLERSVFRDLCSEPSLENAAAFYHLLKRSQGFDEELNSWIVIYDVPDSSGITEIFHSLHLTEHGAYLSAANLIAEVVGDRVEDENEGNMEWVALADTISQLMVTHEHQAIVRLWDAHPFSNQDPINVHMLPLSP